MFKYFFIFFFFLISFTNSPAENKDKIIEKLQNTKNLVFEFEQKNCQREYSYRSTNERSFKTRI